MMGIAEPGAPWGSCSLGGGEIRSLAGCLLSAGRAPGSCAGSGGQSTRGGGRGFGGYTPARACSDVQGPGLTSDEILGAGKKGRTWKKRKRPAFTVMAKNV